MTDSNTYLTCPFCDDSCIQPKPGKARCPMCFSEFEIEDRLEFNFGDPDNPKLPKSGTVCVLCGIFQTGEYQSCLYCEKLIGTTVK